MVLFVVLFHLLSMDADGDFSLSALWRKLYLINPDAAFFHREIFSVVSSQKNIEGVSHWQRFVPNSLWVYPGFAKLTCSWDPQSGVLLPRALVFSALVARYHRVICCLSKATVVRYSSCGCMCGATLTLQIRSFSYDEINAYVRTFSNSQNSCVCKMQRFYDGKITPYPLWEKASNERI